LADAETAGPTNAAPLFADLLGTASLRIDQALPLTSICKLARCVADLGISFAGGDVNNEGAGKAHNDLS
jgi:hypothetical protein